MSFKYIFLSLGISLFLTLILEIAFALVFKVRSKSLLIVLLANVLTNPAVVVLHLLLCRHYTFSEIPVILVLECSAILTEAVVYKHCTDIKKPFLFSLSSNTFSYLCGLLAGSLI